MYLSTISMTVGFPGVSISTCKYADDCTQYELVPTGSDSHMQLKMGNLEAWAVRNNMEINTKKTKVVVVVVAGLL